MDDSSTYHGRPTFDATEACRLAQNLAKNCGYAVFPCGENKNPATPHGFKDASTDPTRVAELWRYHPGPLIGVATGATSSVSVLDVDIEGDEARIWWRYNEQRLPLTRTYRTRRGGLYLVFRHDASVRCKVGDPVEGIDVRGEGGYVIFWFGAGFECVDHAPSAPWPHWLTAFFWPPPKTKPEPRKSSEQSGSNRSAAIDGLIRTVSQAREKTRNNKLNWAAFHIREHISAREIAENEARRRLMDAARDCGLSEKEAARTLKSAWASS